MTTYKNKYTFPKIAFYGNRKINTPEVEIELCVNGDKKMLSICGTVWNASKTDCVICGQCLDEMNDFKSLRHDKTFKELYRLWKLWHLNDLRCGGPMQEAALRDCKLYSYEERRAYLESKNLLYENGIKYGSQWWYHEIADNDLKEIFKLLNIRN